MRKILATLFFVIISITAANAEQFLEELLGWQIRSIYNEYDNTKSCFYSFRAHNFVMTLLHNSNKEFPIMVFSPDFIRLVIPYNTNTSYTVEFNGQKIEGATAIHIRPGFILIVMPDKENIIPNITDNSSIKIINDQNTNLSLEFPIPPNHVAAHAKAVECYDKVNDSSLNASVTPPTSIDQQTSANPLQNIRDRTIQNVSELPLVASIEKSVISLFSYFMGDLESSLITTITQKAISYQNDALYGIFMISVPVGNVNSTSFVNTYKSRISSDKCKTLNASVIVENTNGFLINYVSQCSDLSDPYYNIGYVLYSTKTKQIIEFSQLAKETDLFKVFTFADSLRLSMFEFIAGSRLSTY